MTIILNAIRCKRCDKVIYSRYRHDFNFCKCGAVAIDGGTAYLKRSGDPTSYIELSTSPDYMYALANTLFDWCYDSHDMDVRAGVTGTIEELGEDFVIDLIYLWLIKSKLYIYEPEIFLEPDIEFLEWGWLNPAGSPGNPLSTYSNKGWSQ